MLRFILITLLSMSLFSLTADINKAYFEYSQGRYISASKILHRLIEGNTEKKEFSSELAVAYFMRGVILNRLGNYEKAIKSFLQVKLKERALSGLSYELAQALYAVGNLDDAKKEFLKSVKERYQITPSIYYLAVIYKAKKNYRKAFYFLDKILKLKYNANNIKQMAWTQIAEIHLEQLNKSRSKPSFVEKVVLPSYQKALHFAPDSELATFIQTRIHNVKVRYAIYDKGKDQKHKNYTKKINGLNSRRKKDAKFKDKLPNRKSRKR